MNIRKVADIVKELALEIDCTPYAVLDSLVGMELSEEEVSQIQQAMQPNQNSF